MFCTTIKKALLGLFYGVNWLNGCNFLGVVAVIGMKDFYHFVFGTKSCC